MALRPAASGRSPKADPRGQVDARDIRRFQSVSSGPTRWASTRGQCGHVQVGSAGHVARIDVPPSDRPSRVMSKLGKPAGNVGQSRSARFPA